MTEDWLQPDWPAPPRVRAVCTTRAGGVSRGPWSSMNPADHVDDDPVAVAANRKRLQQALGLAAAPVWLRQVHGTTVVDIGDITPQAVPPEADAALCTRPGRACVVMTADCLPVLLADRRGHCVAAAHAGWRGLAAGVLERTVESLPVPGEELLAWLGPAIGPAAYRVGEEVRAAFVDHDAAAAQAFQAAADGGWQADLYRLARQRLAACGVSAVHGGGYCSYSEPQRFFSYRRDGVTGRMASLIWLAADGA